MDDFYVIICTGLEGRLGGRLGGSNDEHHIKVEPSQGSFLLRAYHNDIPHISLYRNLKKIYSYHKDINILLITKLLF
jgi:hypothetical protein